MSPRRPRRAADVSAVLTAIPAMLGFVPERSIVIVAFGHDGRHQATMRHDLVLDADGGVHPGLPLVLAHLAQICVHQEAAEAIAVIVDDRYDLDDLRYRHILTAADAGFEACGGIEAGYVVSEFASGAPWSRAWPISSPNVGAMAWVPTIGAGPDRCGRLGDPHTCPSAVAHAVNSGRRVLSRRSDMVEMLTPLPHCPDPDCPDPDCPDPDRPDRGAGERDETTLFAELLDWAADPDRPMDCTTLARLGHAVTVLPVRDAALALAVTDLRDNAERLWRRLTRHLRGSPRASAATLLAHLHYIGGEGSYAGVALECALAADCSWSLAQLLDTALQSGMRPGSLWEMLEGSYETARRLGRPIPEPTMRKVS